MKNWLMANQFKTPENAGSFAADLALAWLFQRVLIPEKWMLAAWPPEMATDYWRDFRTMARARNDLEVKGAKEPKS
jgi:hypothetical protein